MERKGKMGSKIAAFFSNDSVFGRAMTKCGIVIMANMMFVLFSLPVVTIGASMCGMYRVMLKMFRGDGDINPFKQFWAGFKGNFKQATIYWLIALVLLVFGYMDFRICRSATGAINAMQYVFWVLGFFWAVLTLYFFPTLTAFDNKLGKLVSNAMFFAVKNPIKAILVFLIYAVPIALTFLDVWLQPLFVFIWAFFGFGLIAVVVAKLLLKEFEPYLPEVDEYGDFV
jgi:uncharacterized membrane protein YesL